MYIYPGTDQTSFLESEKNIKCFKCFILDYKMIKHAPIRRRTLILDDARHLGQQYSYSWITNVEHSD